MAATRKELSDLHAALADVLKEQMQSSDVSPAMLNVARQFLKDCHIDVDPERAPAGVEDLKTAFDEHYVDGMPSFEN